MKKKLGLIIIVVCIFIFYSISSAQPSPVFGPNKYIREKGKPHEFKEIFSLCAMSGIYKLIVDNGTYITTEDDYGDDDDKDKDKKDKHKKKEKEDKKEKKTRVSAGEIEINGEEIIKEHDFKKRLVRVERTINLPQGENLIEIGIKGKPGAYITVSIECVSGCLEPKITFPAANSIINKSKTIVQGDISNLYGEGGVIIQSAGAAGEVIGLAQTQASNFAGIIPLQQGQNTITVQATDACGYKATDTITIQTDTIQEPIRLTTTPSSGILNTAGILPVTFEVETSLPNPISNYTWDLNGDGIPEQTGSTLSRVTANYQYAGLYFPKVTITDTQGNTYEETTIINVLSREEMDALLKGKWDGMKGALSQGNIKKALVYIASGSQNVYRSNFELMSSMLPTIAQDMGNITLVNIEDDAAEYEMTATQDGQTLSFYVEFVRDTDGVWRIKFY